MANKKINIRMIHLSQLIDILVEIEHEGTRFVNLECELNDKKDFIRVVKCSEEEEMTPPSPGEESLPCPIGLPLTEDVLNQLINNSNGYSDN